MDNDDKIVKAVSDFLEAIKPKRDKVMAMFLGIAIGDALGMPVETLTAEQIAKKYGRITDYIQPDENTWFTGWPAGRWTDDTQLTIAIAESLIAKGVIDLDDMAKRQIQAMHECDVGWGGSTKKSLQRIETGVNRLESGNPLGAGNGIPMKVAPLAVYYNLPGTNFYEDASIYPISELALMTHKSDMAIMSGIAQVLTLMHCLEFNPNKWQFLFKPGFGIQLYLLEAIVEKLYETTLPFSRLDKDIVRRLGALQKNTVGCYDWDKLKKMTPGQTADFFGGATCFVYNSLPFTYAMFLKNPWSIETLYDTVNAGGDTDTNGSMVGALLGALNGMQIFPQHLIDSLWQKDVVISVAERFCDKFELN